MKTMRDILTRKDGSALFTVMVVIMITAMALGTAISASVGRVYIVKKIADRHRAAAFAEAGANEAYSILRTNFALRTDPLKFPYRTYGDGGYDASVVPIGDDMATITCTGICSEAHTRVILDIRDYGGTTPEPGPGDGGGDLAFGYAIVSGSTMSWGGSGAITVGGAGKIHSNGEFVMNGGGDVYCDLVEAVALIGADGNCDIFGDAIAPAWDGKFPDRVHGTVTTGPVDLVSIPNIDLTPYYNEALGNGTGSSLADVNSGKAVISGNQHWSAAPSSIPANGIIWINGDLKYTGGDFPAGCTVIVTGNIDWQGGSLENFGDYPVLVSRDGNIDISGNGEFDGLIYVKTGDFEKTGGGEVTGSIIVAGEFTKGGGWSLMTYVESVPIPPGDGEAVGDEDAIGVSAWQK